MIASKSWINNEVFVIGYLKKAPNKDNKQQEDKKQIKYLIIQINSNEGYSKYPWLS